VWAGLLGALMLLFRRRLSFHAYVAGLVGFLANTAYAYVLSDGAKIMGSGAMIFTAVIFVLCVLEVGYSRWMQTKGVLR